MRVLSTIPLVLLFGLSCATGPYKQQAMAEQGPVRIEQRGTQSSPIFISGELTTKKDKLEAEGDERERELKAHADANLVKYTKYLAISTFLLFIFTALLWYQTYRLGKDAKASGASQAEKMEASIGQATRAAAAMEEVATATKNNAVLMQSVLHKQMRAYISVDLGSATYQENTLRFAAHPILANTGYTPARKVSYWALADILPANTPEDFEFPQREPKVTDVGMSPRQSYVIHGVVGNFYPDPEVVEIIKGVERRLFVWGIVSYEDVFGGKWETRFCHSYDFFRNQEGQLTPNGTYHPGHNHAT